MLIRCVVVGDGDCIIPRDCAWLYAASACGELDGWVVRFVVGSGESHGSNEEDCEGEHSVRFEDGKKDGG